MATQSVANTPADVSNELFGRLAAIDSLAKLLQKAHENLADEHSGVYGAALIIEQKAQECLGMIGQ